MSLLSIEPAITDRLASLLPPGTHVRTAASSADIITGRLLAPAVYLIYSGGSLLPPDGYERLLIEQRWLAVCVARNVADAAGAGARDDAGGIADAVISALQAWTPDGADSPLLLAGLPDPGLISGFQLIPLAFTVAVARDFSS